MSDPTADEKREFANLCAMVERLRVATKIPQGVYARLCGVSRVTYINWVNNKAYPKGRRLEAMRTASRAVNAARLAGELPVNEPIPYVRARKIMDIVANYSR